MSVSGDSEHRAVTGTSPRLGRVYGVALRAWRRTTAPKSQRGVIRDQHG